MFIQSQATQRFVETSISPRIHFTNGLQKYHENNIDIHHLGSGNFSGDLEKENARL